MTYIPVDVEVDPTDLAESAYEYLGDQVPGWLPSPGNLEAWLIEALAQSAGELRALATLVPNSIFEYFGESIANEPAYAATPAQGTTTWTMVDTQGYTVDAGSLVAISPPASLDSYAFAVVQAFTVAPGQTVQAGVIVEAVEPGAEASGLTGTVEVLDPLAFVDTVTLDAATTGGTDDEDPDAYIARLSDLMTLLSPRPILPQDFAILAQKSVAGVARATAIDLWKGDTGTPNTPRCVSVACVDSSGNAVSSAIKSQVLALLQSEREVNFLVYVIDPTYTTIDVQFDVSAYPGYVAANVVASVQAALSSYLSPASWGTPPYGDTSGRSWNNATTVRYSELVQVVNEAEGVHYVKTLTFRTGAAAFGTADLVMTGAAPLPRSGSITGTAEVEA